MNKRYERSNADKDVVESGVLTRSRALALILIVATAIALYLSYTLARPFLPALAWALALAVVAYPLHHAISKKIKRRDASAIVTCLVVALVVVAPALLVAQQIGQEASGAIEMVQAEAESGRWKETIADKPALAPVVAWIERQVDVEGEILEMLKATGAQIPSFLRASIWLAIELLITFLVLFYFLRDRGEALGLMQSLSPLTQGETQRMIKRISETIRGTVFGTLIVALVQGILGGVMFWLLGLPAPLLWGAVMVVLSIVPVLGSFVVWLPAAGFLAVQGEVGKALILVLWGTLIVSLIDNLLYPMLVGSQLRMHTLPVFFAIVGGLIVFGASGLILGPVVLAVTVALIDVWRERTRGGHAVDEA